MPVPSTVQLNRPSRQWMADSRTSPESLASTGMSTSAAQWSGLSASLVMTPAELNVPNQIQVLGVDDETYICEQTVPSLSSLKPDFENGGFAAAEFLDGVLHGLPQPAGKGRRRVLNFAFKGVVERMSTADVNGTARRITAAREFIRQHATSGIDVPHIASALGVSVRLLQRDYRAVTGHTVLEDLQSAKLEHVKAMLRTTTTPIDAIGPFCDFKSPAHLKTLFKARFGMTMSTYRKSASTTSAFI